MMNAVQLGRVGASLGQAMVRPSSAAPSSAASGSPAAPGVAALRLITAVMGERTTPEQALDVSA